MTGREPNAQSMPPQESRPRVLFLASRDPAYSRVDLILEALRREFTVIALLSSARSYPRRILSILWAWVRTRPACDVVVVGFFAQPVFPLVRMMTRKPIVSDVYFSIYDTLIHDKAAYGSRHPAAWLARWLDRFTCRNSSAVLTDTTAHVSYLAALTEVNESRFRRIWIGAQPRIFRRLPPPPAPAREAGFPILFYGGFIPLQGVDVIVRAAARLKGKGFIFHLVGAGQTEALCREIDVAENNDNTVFHGWKTQDEVMALAGKCQLVLGVFGSTEKAARVIPNKVFEGLAMGKPVLTGDSPAIRELLTPGHDVIVCRMNDPAALAAAIEWCADHPEELQRIAANGFKTFNDRASPEALAALLKPVIAGCVPIRDH